jgi:hypothetical protein
MYYFHLALGNREAIREHAALEPFDLGVCCADDPDTANYIPHIPIRTPKIVYPTWSDVKLASNPHALRTGETWGSRVHLYFRVVRRCGFPAWPAQQINTRQLGFGHRPAGSLTWSIEMLPPQQ